MENRNITILGVPENKNCGCLESTVNHNNVVKVLNSGDLFATYLMVNGKKVTVTTAGCGCTNASQHN